MKGKKMKLTNKQAKHLITELNYRRDEDELCDTDLSILFRLKKAYPLAVAEIELETLRHSYERLATYNGELYRALDKGMSMDEFQETRSAK